MPNYAIPGDFMDSINQTGFSSLLGYGAPTPVNPLTGGQDYLSGFQPSAMTGIADPSGALGGATSGGFGAGINDWLQSSGILGSTNAEGIRTPGWGGLALGAAQGLGNAFLGMKQYGLAKDTLAANKEQFAKNFANQQKLTNARLGDRQAARVASNPGAYQSVGDYMKQYGV